jgi:hypothetical protein
MLLLTAKAQIVCKKFTKVEKYIHNTCGKVCIPTYMHFPPLQIVCASTHLVVVMQNQLCSCLLHFIYKYLRYLFPSWPQNKWKWLQGVDKPNKGCKNLDTSSIIALHQLGENKCEWNNSFTCNNKYHKQVIVPLFLSLFLVKTHITYWGKFLRLVNESVTFTCNENIFFNLQIVNLQSFHVTNYQYKLRYTSISKSYWKQKH